MNKYNLIVRGMRCAACSSAVSSVLKEYNFSDISVNLITGEVTFSYAENVNIDDVIARINSLGYEANISKGAEDYLKEEKSLKLSVLIIISIIGAILLYISIANMVFTKNPAVPDFLNINLHPLAFVITSFILSTFIVFAGFIFYKPGIKSLLKGKPTMESLVSIGSIVSYLYSIGWMIATFVCSEQMMMSHYAMNTLFDSASIVIVLVYLGKYIEQENNNKSKNEIKNLINILPSEATILRDDQMFKVCINEVEVGDIILVKEGERAPVDGIISKGTCLVDRSAITGFN